MPVNPANVTEIKSKRDLSQFKTFRVCEPEYIDILLELPSVVNGEFALVMTEKKNGKHELVIMCKNETCGICKPDSRSVCQVQGNSWATLKSRHGGKAPKPPSDDTPRPHNPTPKGCDSDNEDNDEGHKDLRAPAVTVLPDAVSGADLMANFAFMLAKMRDMSDKIDGISTGQSSISARLAVVEKDYSDIVGKFHKMQRAGDGNVVKKVQKVAPCPKGTCIVCKVDPGVHMQLSLLGSPEFNGGGNGRAGYSVRLQMAKTAYSMLRANVICRKPQCTDGRTLLVDFKNQNGYCMNCRTARSTAHITCSSCSGMLEAMARSHAQDKEAFYTCVGVVGHTVFNIVKLKSIDEHNPWLAAGAGDGPTNDKAGQVDSVVIIDTSYGKKLLFVIEFQNSKREDPVMLTHKLGQCMETHKPYKTFLWCVSIAENSSRLRLEERFDVVRRWMILATLHADTMPKWSNWWFFQRQNDVPITRSKMTPFLQNPIIIQYAPEGERSDWQYAPDPLAGHRAISMRGKRKISLGKRAAESTNMEPKEDEDASADSEETESEKEENAGTLRPRQERKKPDLRPGDVFGYLPDNEISVRSVLGEGWPNTWNLTDYSKVDAATYMYCTPDCTMCARYFGGRA